MLEEGKVKRSANSVILVLGEDNVTAVVTAFDSTQDVLGVILAIPISLDCAGPLTRRRSGKRFSRVIRRNWVIGSL